MAETAPEATLEATAPEATPAESKKRAREEEAEEDEDEEEEDEEEAAAAAVGATRRLRERAQALREWEQLACAKGEAVAVRAPTDDEGGSEGPYYLALLEESVAPTTEGDVRVRWLEPKRRSANVFVETEDPVSINVGALLAKATLVVKDKRLGEWQITEAEKQRLTKLAKDERVLEKIGAAASSAAAAAADDEEEEGTKKKTKKSKKTATKKPKRGGGGRRRKVVDDDDEDAVEGKEDDEEDEDEDEEKEEPKPRRRRSSTAASTPKRAKKADGSAAATPRKKREKKSAEAAEKKPRKKRGPPVVRPEIVPLEHDLEFKPEKEAKECCRLCSGKRLIAAAMSCDHERLRAVLEDETIHSIFVRRSPDVPRTALHYAALANDIEAIKLIGAEMARQPARKRAAPPGCALETLSTGSYSEYTYGHRVRRLNVSRAGKEGNQAFLCDRDDLAQAPQIDLVNLVDTVLRSPAVKPETVDALVLHIEGFGDAACDRVVQAIETGNCALAAHLIGTLLKDHGSWGFNAAHLQALSLGADKDIDQFRAASVTKKPMGNYEVTPLHAAATNPCVKHLKALLAIVPEINRLDFRQRRLLHYAAVCSGTGPVEFLLSQHADPLEADKLKVTPLMLAAQAGRIENIKLLLESQKAKDQEMAAAPADDGALAPVEGGGDEEAGEDEDGEEEDDDEEEGPRARHKKPAAAAGGAQLGGKSCFERLLNGKCRRGNTPLHYAVDGNQPAVIASLLSFGAAVDTANTAKMTPLALAASLGHLACVKLLVEEGHAQLDSHDKVRRTPLMHAAKNGHSAVVSYLLHRGADYDAADSSGNTPVHYAAAYGWPCCLKLLTDAGASPCASNIWKTSPLLAATLKGHFFCVDFLLHLAGVDVNVRDDTGRTLLMHIVAAPNELTVAQVRFLVERKRAVPFYNDSNGDSALHIVIASEGSQQQQQQQHRGRFRFRGAVSEDQDQEAESKKQLEEYVLGTVSALIDLGAHPNTQNEAGQTPLGLAVTRFRTNVALELLRRGCEVAWKDASGNNILHMLAETCGRNIVFSCSPQEDESSLQQPRWFGYNQPPPPRTGVKGQFEDFVAVLQLVCMHRDAVLQMQAEVNDAGETPLLVLMRHVADVKKNEKDDSCLLRIQRFVQQFVEYTGSNLDAMVAKPKDSAKKQSTGEEDEEEDEDYDESPEEAEYTFHFRGLKDLFKEETEAEKAERKRKEEEKKLPASHHFTVFHVLANSPQRFEELLVTLTKMLLETRRMHAELLVQATHGKRTALHIAIENKYAHLALMLLAGCPESAALPNERGATPLMLAASMLPEVANRLLADGTRRDLCVAFDKAGRTALHYAAEARQAEVCARLIANGAETNVADEKGLTPLHLSVNAVGVGDTYCGDTEDLLIRAGSLPNATDKKGRTPLHYALVKQGKMGDTSKYDPVEVVSLLLGMPGLDTNIRDSVAGRTPLHYAAMRGATISSLLLMKKGAKSEVVDTDGNTVLGVGMCSGHQDYATILAQGGVDVQHKVVVVHRRRKEDGRAEAKTEMSAFKLAAKNNWQGVCFMLLECGFPLDLALHAALQNGQLHMAGSLLRKLPPADAPKLAPTVPEGLTLLHSVAMATPSTAAGDFTAMCNTLLSLLGPATPTVVDSRGRTMLHYATESLNLVLCRWALAHGTPIELQDKQGNCALALCIARKRVQSKDAREVAELLLSSGAHPNVRFVADPATKPKFLATPLIHAIRSKAAPTISLLLRHPKIDTNFADGKGRTPLMHAVRCNDVDTVKALLAIRGTDARLADARGWTVLHHTVAPSKLGSFENKELLRLFVENGLIDGNASKDTRGHTAFYYALLQESGVMARCLRELHCDEEKFTKPPERASSVITDWSSSAGVDPDEDSAEVLRAVEAKMPPAPATRGVDPIALKNVKGVLSVVYSEGASPKPYDALLTIVEVGKGKYGINNFYRMQVLHNKTKDFYLLWTRWGRVGETGQFQQTPFVTKELAAKEFESILRKKSKYRIVNLETRANAMQKARELLRPFDLRKSPRPLFESDPLFDLMTLVTDLASLHQALRQSGINTEAMPLGRLNAETIAAARHVLEELVPANEAVEAARRAVPFHPEALKKAMENVEGLSNKFYELLPTGQFATSAIQPISGDNLQKKLAMVDSLSDMQIASKILLGAQARAAAMNPLEYVYRAMGASIEALDSRTAEYKLVANYARNTAPNSGKKVVYIYRIQRKGEPERMAPFKALGNRCLLWHGSGVANYMGILSQGLRIAPVEARQSGAAFGKGIYFADTLEKALGYCDVSEKRPGLLLLCEVALGTTAELKKPRDMTEELPLPGTNSTKACGQRGVNWAQSLVMGNGVRIPTGRIVDMPKETDENGRPISTFIRLNEYVVYNVGQIRMRYLVMVVPGKDDVAPAAEAQAMDVDEQPGTPEEQGTDDEMM